MQKKHHYTDYQQDVDEASRNMKGEEPEQPQDDQNPSDYSKHVVNSFTHQRVTNRNLLSRPPGTPDASSDSCW